MAITDLLILVTDCLSYIVNLKLAGSQYTNIAWQIRVVEKLQTSYSTFIEKPKWF